MEDNSKLFVFEKKEVLLIFAFIVLISVISFTMGVRTGKKLSLKQDGFTKKDVNTIDLKSREEENVENAVKDPDVGMDTSSTDSLGGEETSPTIEQSEIEKRLKEEMAKLAQEDVEVPPTEVKVDESPEIVESVKPQNTESSPQDLYNQNKDFKGKYTIQLFSNQSENAAKDFADGFIAKGYDVIINEVIIAGQGKWYRVSLGVFDNVNDAKEYLSKEKSLFQDKKYFIQQF